LKSQSSVQFGEYLALLIAERKNVFKVKYSYDFSSSLRTHYTSLFFEDERSEKSSPSNNWILWGKNFLKLSIVSIKKKQLMN